MKEAAFFSMLKKKGMLTHKKIIANAFWIALRKSILKKPDKQDVAVFYKDSQQIQQNKKPPVRAKTIPHTQQIHICTHHPFQLAAQTQH